MVIEVPNEFVVMMRRLGRIRVPAGVFVLDRMGVMPVRSRRVVRFVVARFRVAVGKDLEKVQER